MSSIFYYNYAEIIFVPVIKKSSLSGIKIIGICVGIVLLILFCGVICICLYLPMLLKRKKKPSDTEDDTESTEPLVQVAVEDY